MNRQKPIKQHRLERLMTQRALAKAAGITQSALWSIESGRTIPKDLTLYKIAYALGIDPLDIQRDSEAA